MISLHRTGRGRFAIDELGEWQTSIKTTLCTPHVEGLSVAYLGGLLNSELLDLWYGHRGRNPRDVWRDYEPKPMARIPYRHVESVATPEGSDWLNRLAEALDERDAARAQALSGGLAAEGTDRELAGAVELLVRAIAANRKALLPLRGLFPDLSRTVKDPWRARTPDLSVRAAVAGLSDAEKISVRIDPALELDIHTDGPLGRGAVSKDGLVFTRARRNTATVTGPADRLELLEHLLDGHKRLMPADLEATLLPRQIDALQARRSASEAAVSELLEEGRVLVEAVERLVCQLYDVPAELEEAVVRHAAERAVAGLPAED